VTGESVLFIVQDDDDELYEEILIRIGQLAGEYLQRCGDPLRVHAVLSEVQLQLLESYLEREFAH
jgi:hypothetical protein